jgi:hypothetical protein
VAAATTGPLVNTDVASSTGASIAVTVNATTTQVLAANPLRTGAVFYNLGSQTIFLGFGFVPTTSVFSAAIAATAPYVLPIPWKGVINGIVASTTAAITGTEFTP